jgi:hypothetical protein
VLAELLVLLVLVGGCIAIVAVKVLTPVRSPADATREYLAALRTGDTAKAFALLCRQGRTKLTRATFAQSVAEERRANGAVVKYRILAELVESGGTARVRYTLTTTKRVGTVEALLEKDGGAWKLCDFRQLPP